MPPRAFAFRAGLARTFRVWTFRAWCAGSPWWAAAIAVVADAVDPERPESIRDPRRWAWRIVPALSPSTPDPQSGHPEP